MQSWNRTSHFKSHFLLIWNFQIRFEMRCAIWNFLKLDLLIWNFRWDLKMRCYLKLLKLETFQTHHGGLLLWNIQMRLEMRCAIGTFKTGNFSTHHRNWLFETFRWDLKWDVLFEIFETFQLFQNPSQKLLIWNFQMRHKCNGSEKYLALFCHCSWDRSNPQVNKNPTTGFPSHTFIYSRLMLCNKSKNTGVTLNNSLDNTIIPSQRLVTTSASLHTQTGSHRLIIQVLNIKSLLPKWFSHFCM